MKKMLSTFLMLIMVFNVSATAFAALPEYGEEYQNQPAKEYPQIFNDVDADFWAFTYIAEMAEREVLSGYPNGNFYPNNTVTRAEFAKIMCLAAGLTVNAVNSTSYDDVKVSSWYAPFVECGKYFLSGYIADGKKYYKPEDKALREDIAVALVKLKGYDTSVYDESILKAMFTDWKSISEGARKYVSVAVENGLISGYEDNTFRGQASITRAEAATLLWRAYQYGNGNKVFEKEDFNEPVSNSTPTDTTTETDNEEKLKLTLSVDKTNININSGDIAEFTATVGFNYFEDLNADQTRKGYVPNLDGDVDVLENMWGSEKNTDNNQTVILYKTKALDTGKYVLNLSVEDDYTTTTEKVTIIVAEPEPDYTFELKTLENNVKNIYAMVATDDSVIYLTHSMVNDSEGGQDLLATGEEKIVEIKKDSTSTKTIISSGNIDYLGTEELSKSDEARLKTYIIALGYNKYDSSPYAIMKQSAGSLGTKYYLFNLYTEDFSELETKDTTSPNHQPNYMIGGHWDRIFAMTKSGEIFNRQGFLYRGGGIGGSVTSNHPVIIEDTPFVGINYVNTRTGKWETLDYYISYYATYLTSSNNYLYFVDGNAKEIYTVDINGDYEKLCGINDIDNIDGKVINMATILDAQAWLAAAGDDGTLYYFDNDYNCIRQLSEK